MEENYSKRRKINHDNDASILDTGSAAASAMGPSGASAFVLETDELLKDAKLDYAKALTGVDNILRQFKDAIEALEPHDPTPINELSTKFEKTSRIAIPFPHPRPAKDSHYKLSFAKPAQVNVVGSYALKTMVKSSNDQTADMIVVMPTSIFQEKDYLNLRYFYKRAYYLAYIASGLRKAHGSSMEFNFDYLNENPLLPVLVARPKQTSNKNDAAKGPTQIPAWGIRVIPTAPEGYFPVTKLSATSNAVRQGSAGEAKEAKPPTPFYNATLKAEGLFTSYLKLLHRTSNSCPAFQDACILGRIWLQQRGLGGSVSEGGFGHFEWAVLVALLLQGGGRKGEAVLSTSLHSTQIFKGTLQFIASSSLRKKPVIIGKTPADPESIRQSGPVLYDAARELNIVFKMTSWSTTMLKEQAKRSLSAMNDDPNGQFDSLFIMKAYQPLQMFDLLVKLNLPSSNEDHSSTDCKGFAWNYSERVYQILTKALGERARFIHLETPKTASWAITNPIPKTKKGSIIVGIAVDPTKASQGREYGPPYEQKKDAAKFREFWGEKSDLWQFPDGNIVESLDWTAYTPLGFPGICEAIIRYILKYRLKVDDTDLAFYGQDFTKLITSTPSDKGAFDVARQAFQQFERDVRGLEDLPLHVRQIVPICPELRHASLRIPRLGDLRRSQQPMDVVISFEASGKWPEENLAAIQRAKLAFLLKIGSSLEESNDAIKAHLGLETTERDVEDLAFLDVVYKDGFSFRVRVHSGLEEILLERQTKDKTLERYQRTEAAELLATFRRTYTNLPLHNQTITTFCTRFPELSPSIRLVKRFFSAHKLSCHFNEELIELFTLQAFLKPHPYATPTSAATGFLRTLLLLSRWDWRDDPLIVDPSASDLSSPQQRNEVRTRLEAWRKIDPAMNRTVLFVATPHDPSGLAYTQPLGCRPSRVVATRMTALARSACRLARDKGIDLDPRSLFQPSLREYDVVIRLAPKVLRNLERVGGEAELGSSSRFKNLLSAASREEEASSPPLPEHPARVLLAQLDRVYGRPLLFFHGDPGDDNDGGSAAATIGALWNPQLLNRRAFTANLPCSFMPVRGGDGDGDVDVGGEAEDDVDGEKSKKMYEVNRQAILAEIARIGGDLIEGIDVKGDDR
ncbi:U3 snoRNP protein [Diatrype stigma]|uniref:U3 small nucleolar RNA-associated protein 22 n=1 Tax=Diatrype stigma TaxID=117547 RepID=A0AAN9YSM2_9PEZI